MGEKKKISTSLIKCFMSSIKNFIFMCLHKHFPRFFFAFIRTFNGSISLIFPLSNIRGNHRERNDKISKEKERDTFV